MPQHTSRVHALCTIAHTPPQSRYIEALLDKAVERKREQDIRYERQLLREREAEDHLFGDKDVFVTAAYRRKLEEDKLWQAQQDKRCVARTDSIAADLYQARCSEAHPRLLLLFLGCLDVCVACSAMAALYVCWHNDHHENTVNVRRQPTMWHGGVTWVISTAT